MKSIRNLLSVTLLLVGNLFVYSQDQKTSGQETHQAAAQSFDLMPKRSDFNTWTVGLNIGPSIFYGTITSSAYYLQRPTLKPGLFYGVTLKKSISHLFGIEGDVAMGNLKGENDVHHATMDTKVNYDISINGVFTFGNFTWIQRNHKLNLVSSIGFGQISFLPKLTDDMKADKADIYQTTFTQYRDSLFVHRGLGNTSEFTFPVSLGLAYELNNHINLMFRYRYTVSLGSKLDYTWNPLVYSQSYGWISLGAIYVFGKKERNIDWVNPIGDIYSQLAKVDQKIDGLADTTKKQLAGMQAKIDSLGNNTDKKLGDFNNKIDSMNANFKSIINTVNNFVTNTQGELELYFPSIYFPLDVYAIQYTEFERIAYIAKVLNYHPKMKLMITGHCDEHSSAQYNLTLGTKRAEEVKKHLIKIYGIDGSRLLTESKGKNEPLAKNIHEINRRVDFTIAK